MAKGTNQTSVKCLLLLQSDVHTKLDHYESSFSIFNFYENKLTQKLSMEQRVAVTKKIVCSMLYRSSAIRYEHWISTLQTLVYNNLFNLAM